MINQPYSTLKTMTCKRCGDDEDRVQGFCSNHCKDLKEVEELREYKKNWIELKTQLAFSVENYGDDDFDISVDHQILKEMNRLEGEQDGNQNKAK